MFLKSLLKSIKEKEIKREFDMEIVEAAICQVNTEIGQKILESKSKERIKALKECKSLTRSLLSSIIAKHLGLKK